MTPPLIRTEQVSLPLGDGCLHSVTITQSFGDPVSYVIGVNSIGRDKAIAENVSKFISMLPTHRSTVGYSILSL